MNKVFLGVGHGGSDSGATANGLKEKDINLNIALACKAELERYGVQVGISRLQDEDDPVELEVKKCNEFNPDLAVDIHTNAGGGKGFEIFHSIVGGLGKTLAENINSQIITIGQNTRGVKTRKLATGDDYYYFIRQTKCHAVIAECAFIDNAADVQLINTIEKQKAFGIAYAKAILKTLNIQTTNASQNKLTTEQFIIKIRQYVIVQAKRINILPSLKMAQAILESSSGNSELATKANNLYGIKASNWNGQTYTKLATEFVSGQNISLEAKFRAYRSFEESIKDHSDFLSKPRYSALVGQRDYKVACQTIKDAGYATDSNYPQKLLSIIENYELYNLDKEAYKMEEPKQYPQYKKDGEKYLRDMLYITSKHDPQEIIDFGTLGVILMSYNKIHNVV